jgi:hypothetical protein
VPQTIFHGVSDEPRGGVLPGVGLYDFRTTAGSRILLHNTDLRFVTHRAEAPATLELVFEYDSAWAPRWMVDPPLVVMHFDDVRITAWEDDPWARLPDDDRGGNFGQVYLFDWDGDLQFDLRTYATRITFTSSAATVSTGRYTPVWRSTERQDGTSAKAPSRVSAPQLSLGRTSRSTD